MTKVGFEVEAFVEKVGPNTEIVLPPKGVPVDDCGYLVEYRGEAHQNPMRATYNTLAEIKIVEDMLSKNGLVSRFSPWEKLSEGFKREALIGRAKRLVRESNLYGLKQKNPGLARAGLHVHFSREVNTVCRCGQVSIVYGMLDMPAIIKALDQAFKEGIKDAKRVPGMYRLKPYGFEYRSLPNNIGLVLVARTLMELGDSILLA